jgi:hypothetical protein
MPSGVRFALERAIKSTTTKAASTGAKGPASFFGKKKKSPKIQTKVVKIYPSRTLGGEIKGYRDSEGRTYEPVTWNERSGTWQLSDSRMHMRRDDGVIFKLRKDGMYQIVIPKQPRRKKPRRR